VISIHLSGILNTSLNLKEGRATAFKNRFEDWVMRGTPQKLHQLNDLKQHQTFTKVLWFVVNYFSEGYRV
jgi:hypothetical protein